MASISAAVSVIFGEDLYGELARELLVLGVFVASFVAWRQLRQKRGTRFAAAAAKLKLLEHEDFELPPARNQLSSEVSRHKRQRSQLQLASEGPRQQQTAASKALEQQMIRHLEQHEFTRALNMYRSLERDGRDRMFSEELHSSFIQSAVRVGKLDVVERMLRGMRRSGAPPSLRFWQTTLKMLSSRKHFSVCLSVHSIFGNLLPTDKVVYSCLINAALEVGTLDQVDAMLRKYSKADIETKDHVLYFRAFAASGDADSAEGVFRRLGNKATSLMLNLLLLTCANTKQPERALRILRDAHQLEKTQEDERMVDVVSYNTVIKGFAQIGGTAQCFECFHAMVKHGLEPDDITFGTLLDACVTDCDTGAAEDIVGLLLSSERKLDTVMCTLFIKGLVRAGCLPKALELYKEMLSRQGAHPDIVTYSVLIKALVDQHDLDRALQLVEDMRASGHSPDDIILTHLLEGCRHAGNHAFGTKLFEDMLDAGVKPSEFTLVAMLKLHGRCRAHKEAHDLVAGWSRRHGLEPSVIHYTCLMSGCLRTKSFDQAWAAYELMRSNSVAPDETSISTLLPGMVAAQQWDRVLEIARAALMSTPHVNIPAEILNNALSQILAAGSHGQQAEELQGLMRSAGVRVATRRVRRPA